MLIKLLGMLELGFTGRECHGMMASQHFTASLFITSSMYTTSQIMCSHGYLSDYFATKIENQYCLTHSTHSTFGSTTIVHFIIPRMCRSEEYACIKCSSKIKFYTTINLLSVKSVHRECHYSACTIVDLKTVFRNFKS